MDFSTTLINWFHQNKRDLPWRKTKDPYKIWLSEIILQQTRVAQGMPYYKAFVKEFPNVQDLAKAPEEKVLKLWQGLGYYSRARNLHAAAQYVANDLKGVFPSTYKELLQLKGVGEYTAAAIASIAFNEDVAVVDGNVFRVLARYFGIELDISQPKTKKEFQDLANNLLPSGKASDFNQALMEFGAMQCVPKSPNCANCVFNTSCYALQHNKVSSLPIKLKRIKVKNRYLNYIVVIDAEGKVLVEQRKGNGIWKNLYQFPLIETEKKEKRVVVEDKIQERFKPKTLILKNEEAVVHKLSHQHLHILFFEIHLSEVLEVAVSMDFLRTKPFPIVLYNFLEANYLD